MAASLATQHYQLGKYAPNDLTDYLVTYNGTMDKIDAGMHAAQDAADTAQAQADANLNNINALSQNLTATNKNVENLGKAQTAQQTEIDNANSEISALKAEIGDVVTVPFVGVAGEFTLSLSQLRRIKNNVIGAIACYVQNVGTVNASRTLSDGKVMFDLARATGNPLNLTDGSTSFAPALVGAENQTDARPVIMCIYYDASSNYTAYGFIGGGVTSTFQNSYIYHTF